MSVRTRSAALVAIAAVGLVLLAYGVGGAIGGGSASAVGTMSAPKPALQQRTDDSFTPSTREAADQRGTAAVPHRRPCPHHDGQGQDSGGDPSTQTAPDPNLY